jgi:hypothetical protein
MGTEIKQEEVLVQFHQKSNRANIIDFLPLCQAEQIIKDG